MTTRTLTSNPGWGPLWRGLVSDPTAKHYRRLKNGCLWLLLYAITTANPKTGKLVTTWGEIAKETGLSEQHIRSLAGHLRTKGYVNVVPHGQDQVVLVVAKWRPVILGRLRTGPAPVLALPAPRDEKPKIPVVVPPLVREIAKALDADEHMDEIADLLTAYPEPIIRRFLESATQVPQERIRASRWALFRWLLNHYDKNTTGG